MKLPNGYGSVYKLQGNRRKPFVARKTVGFEQNKEKKKSYPVYQIIGYYEKRSEALAALAEFNKNPYDIEARNTTLADMYETFKKRRFDKISKSGNDIYNAAYKHLKPLWDCKIIDLKTYHFQELIDNLDRKRQTKDHIRTLLNQIFDIAIELDICNKNYAKFITLETKQKSEKHKAFTNEEIKLIANNVDKVPNMDIALMLIYTGMRPNELLKMKKEDVFLEERYMVGGSKTKAGKDRIIPIHKKILPLIEKRYSDSKIYLIESQGKHITVGGYRDNLWQDTIVALGLNNLPYDCRHTFASLMNTAGANSLATKLIMGHSTQDITDGTYTHKQLDELLKNIDLLE
ncbi:tyrosine-type recombinase/integrase [Anaerotignum sp.]|uniref:tyrosine-type recombinase/integrase n=1 Tax=Anaerotignum sp. TaxID=2039241 RepID=UPI002714BB42|nr:site-specific integrase [Anaerotignum sp.]